MDHLHLTFLLALILLQCLTLSGGCGQGQCMVSSLMNQWAHSDSQKGQKEASYLQNLKESTAFPVSSCKCCWTNPSVSKYFIQNLTRRIFGDYLFWSNACCKPVEKSMRCNLFIPQTPFSSFFLHQQCVHVLFILVMFSLYFPELTFSFFLEQISFCLMNGKFPCSSFFGPRERKLRQNYFFW